LYSKLKTN